MTSRNEAQKPNPALEPFTVLVGDWSTTGTHPHVPGKILHGKTTVEWMEGGAFLIMHSEIDEPEIPNGVAVFGSDDVTGTFFILYFDERGVSRKYNVTFEDEAIVWARHTPEFSQRMVLTVAQDGKTMESKGEMSKDSRPWASDLALTYTRVA